MSPTGSTPTGRPSSAAGSSARRPGAAGSARSTSSRPATRASRAPHQRFEHVRDARGDRRGGDRPRRLRHRAVDARRRAPRRGAGHDDLDHRPAGRGRLQRRRQRGRQHAPRLHRDLRRHVGGGADGRGGGRADARGQPVARLARRPGDPGLQRPPRRLADRGRAVRTPSSSPGRSTPPATGTAAGCTSPTTTASGWSTRAPRCVWPRAGPGSGPPPTGWTRSPTSGPARSRSPTTTPPASS